MTGIYQTRTSGAAGWALAVARFSVVLMALAALLHRYGFLGTPDFLATMLAVSGLAVLGLLLAAIAFRMVWKRGDAGSSAIAFAVLFSAVALAPLAAVSAMSLVFPEIHDVSTDLTDPPPLMQPNLPAGMVTNAPGPILPKDAEKIAAAWPEATGRRYEVSIDRAVEAVTQLMADRQWPVTAQRGAIGADGEIIIFAMASSAVLRFPSDVAVRITDEGATVFVDMRSASRYGRRDFGGNARWIIGFLAELDVAIATGPAR